MRSHCWHILHALMLHLSSSLHLCVLNRFNRLHTLVFLIEMAFHPNTYKAFVASNSLILYEDMLSILLVFRELFGLNLFGCHLKSNSSAPVYHGSGCLDALGVSHILILVLGWMLRGLRELNFLIIVVSLSHLNPFMILRILELILLGVLGALCYLNLLIMPWLLGILDTVIMLRGSSQLNIFVMSWVLGQLDFPIY